jgi:hypothetical protein
MSTSYTEGVIVDGGGATVGDEGVNTKSDGGAVSAVVGGGVIIGLSEGAKVVDLSVVVVIFTGVVLSFFGNSTVTGLVVLGEQEEASHVKDVIITSPVANTYSLYLDTSIPLPT